MNSLNNPLQYQTANGPPYVDDLTFLHPSMLVSNQKETTVKPLPVNYVPGEWDVICERGKSYLGHGVRVCMQLFWSLLLETCYSSCLAFVGVWSHVAPVRSIQLTPQSHPNLAGKECFEHGKHPGPMFGAPPLSLNFPSPNHVSLGHIYHSGEQVLSVLGLQEYRELHEC